MPGASYESDELSEIRALKDALRELVDACGYVKPFSGAVATSASVKDVRHAGRFMAAVENAKKILDD